MAEIENSKLAIIGAGAVGTSIAYAAIIRGSAREVVISDVDAARVEAEMLDLTHGTLFTGSTSITGGDDLDIVIGAHVIVITAGAKQHAGQSRLDLASTNVDILNAQEQIYTARRDLFEAKLRYLLAKLRLAADVGALGDDDIASANAYLGPKLAF